MNDANFQPAKLTDDGKAIIDSYGNVVKFDDPRVVFVWPAVSNRHQVELIEHYFRSWGFNFRKSNEMSHEILQHAKNICSGRECLPFNAVAGSIYKDYINTLEKDEIKIYLFLDQEGPCENGAWPVILDSFIKRNQIKNVIPMIWVNIETNFFDKGIRFAKNFLLLNLLVDIFDEVEGVLYCVAEDREQAIKVFNDETEKIIKKFCDDYDNLKKFLTEWALALKKIPIKKNINKTPKILLLGGLNLQFLYHPVYDLLKDQRVIIKYSHLTDTLILLVSEILMRYGYKNFKGEVGKYFSLLTHFKVLIKGKLIKTFGRITKSDKEKRKAMKSFFALLYMESQVRAYRKIVKKSGLLYDDTESFASIIKEGNKYASFNAVTETSIIVGQYIKTVKKGKFDGIVNIGSFNCQPAQNSLAIIRSLVKDSNIPTISIDLDGHGLSSNHKKLIESIVLQAKRHKNKA